MNFFQKMLVAVVVLLPFSSVEADHKLCSKNSRMYVKPQDIAVAKSGILMSRGDKLFVVRSLSCDSKGLFVSKKDVIKCVARNNGSMKQSKSPFEKYAEKGTWECLVCHRQFGTRAELYDHIWDEHGPYS